MSDAAHPSETFFTVVGCMDGRVQEVTTQFGKKKFGAKYPDKISEAGMVGIIAKSPSEDFVKDLKLKLLISLNKHNSRGILVDGHEDCVGNPVDDDKHHKDVRKSVEFIRSLTGDKVPVIGVFVTQTKGIWQAEELTA